MKLKPCRFCGAEPFVITGNDSGDDDDDTGISCSCKMDPLISALFYRDAAKMWNAAMSVTEPKKPGARK